MQKAAHAVPARAAKGGSEEDDAYGSSREYTEEFDLFQSLDWSSRHDGLKNSSLAMFPGHLTAASVFWYRKSK